MSPLQNSSAAGLHRFLVQATDLLSQTDDLYENLNLLRDWFNGRFGEHFDFYLEDVWNDNVDGETHFEYILQSRQTLNETPVLAYDVYLNHQDSGGVWHLDDYQYSVATENIPQVMAAFMGNNGHIF